MNDQMMRLAIEAGFLDGDLELFPETIERFAELVRQDERDKCAKILDEFAEDMQNKEWTIGAAAMRGAANTIRANGNYEDAPLP